MGNRSATQFGAGADAVGLDVGHVAVQEAGRFDQDGVSRVDEVRSATAFCGRFQATRLRASASRTRGKIKTVRARFQAVRWRSGCCPSPGPQPRR